MQRVFLWLSTLFALYVSGFACATDNPLPPGDERPVPHIALLLPLKSEMFGSAADAVQRGFMAAANLVLTDPNSLPVRVYSSFDEGSDIVALYRLAVTNGARGVVGPLTRSGVAMLAAESEIPVPTLALNLADRPAAAQLYFFGMAAEAEARQIAQIAKQNGHQQAIVIVTRSQLSHRLQLAFEEEWYGTGGSLVREMLFDADPSVLAEITSLQDTAVFLAADAMEARKIRPFLPKSQPIYATSQVFLGNSDTLGGYDLDGVRFVDMPWLLQTDHPAVMVYPRANPPLSVAHERLYGLGIDAFRLMELMLGNKLSTHLPLDGVSGRLRLDGHIFQRAALPARFEQGHAEYRAASAPSTVRMFPDQVLPPAPPGATAQR
ncbi:MAG: penicillin-binding protein activator [Gallionella sp.]|nr:penicillin-binding protein activator [Gallionella sp.]